MFGRKRDPSFEKVAMAIAFHRALSLRDLFEQVGYRSTVDRSLCTKQSSFSQVVIPRQVTENKRSSSQADQRVCAVIRDCRARRDMVDRYLLGPPAIASNESTQQAN